MARHEIISITPTVAGTGTSEQEARHPEELLGPFELGMAHHWLLGQGYALRGAVYLRRLTADSFNCARIYKVVTPAERERE